MAQSPLCAFLSAEAGGDGGYENGGKGAGCVLTWKFPHSFRRWRGCRARQSAMSRAASACHRASRGVAQSPTRVSGMRPHTPRVISCLTRYWDLIS
ncbi:Protein of unknown function, partial [Gryllus bimaculatus]